MAVRRIMPYHESPDLEATRAFYTGVLGLEEGTFGGGYIGFGSGQAEVVFAPPGVEPLLPDMGVDAIRPQLSMRHTPMQSGPGTR
jgi:catechol 2,3-dioxygenase-like lactoylglutathione lyase family enzyme